MASQTEKAALLSLDPPDGKFPKSGASVTHQVVSNTDSRLAFKVKSSNNEHYRVRPVYGFVEGRKKSPLEILRLNGAAKEDRLIIQWAEVPAEETDAQGSFKAGAQSGEITVKLKAE